MVDRTIQLAESLREVARLGRQPVSEVTPSRRDFTQYVATQRQGLAVVARVGRRAAASADALLAHARACDDAEVAALAVATSSAELSLQDMAAIAAATSAPILREALILDRSQLYASRLHGADAVILAAPELGAPGRPPRVGVTRALPVGYKQQRAHETDAGGGVRLFFFPPASPRAAGRRGRWGICRGARLGPPRLSASWLR